VSVWLARRCVEAAAVTAFHLFALFVLACGIAGWIVGIGTAGD
jgi:hypothetical protein